MLLEGPDISNPTPLSRNNKYCLFLLSLFTFISIIYLDTYLYIILLANIISGALKNSVS